jgi:uncharacterized protein
MYDIPMPSKFYGRARELRQLREELQLAESTHSARVVAIRGRRQVGKSTLVERFAESADVPYATFAGLKDTPEGIQVARALDSAASSKRPLPGPIGLDQATPVSSWVQLFAFVRFSFRDAPALVVCDEFPWMNETSPGLDGLLKGMLDTDLKRLPVLIILVGSDEAMMERLFEHDRPLFGKADLQIQLEPFNPAETAKALGDERRATENFDAYLVTGGFPGLLDEASRSSSTREFVRRSLLQKNSALVDQARIRLVGELADSGSAELVLRTIGADEIGVVNFSRIAGELGGGITAQTTVTRATDLLSEKGLVAIDYPGGRRNSRLKRYRVADSYLRFWFRFVDPYLRQIEVDRADVVISAFDADFDTWRGKAIEPIAREGVLRLAARLGAPYESIASVDGWWDRRGSDEFDLVGSNRHGDVEAVGTVKWRERRKVDENDFAQAAKARSVVRGASAARVVAVCPAGVKQGVSFDLALDAEELLSAWEG